MPISMSGFKSIRNLFNKIQKHQKPIYRAKSLGHGSSRPLWVFCILARGQDGTKDFLWILGRAGKWLNSCQNCCLTKDTKYQTFDLPFPFVVQVKRVFFAFLLFLPESPSESSSLLLSCLPFVFFWEPDPYTYSLAFCLVLSSVSSSSVFGFQMKMDLQGQPHELCEEGSSIR